MYCFNTDAVLFYGQRYISTERSVTLRLTQLANLMRVYIT